MNGKGNEMAGHTPGPWVIGGTPDAPWPRPVGPVVGAEVQPVAEVFGLGCARLIAAAPEMLAALTRIANADPGPSNWTPEELAVMVRRFQSTARAAVARAEGRG